MPAYNAAGSIVNALASIIAQQDSDWEVVMVDDGSTDDTCAQVAALAAQDSRIKLIRNPHSGRPAVARNTGLRAARGHWLCFLDADDHMHPARLAGYRQAAAAVPEADILLHDMRLFKSRSELKVMRQAARISASASAESTRVWTSRRVLARAVRAVGPLKVTSGRSSRSVAPASSTRTCRTRNPLSPASSVLSRSKTQAST